jgi:hypothetical protein
MKTVVLSLSCSSLAALAIACALPPKDLGEETMSGGGDGGASGEDTGVGMCQDGDTMPAGDGCNTCYCEEGQWACTAIGCEPTASGGGSEGGVCQDGDTMPAGDGCNTCYCEGGQWACTEIACPGTDSGSASDSGGSDGGGMNWFGDEVLICDPGAPMDALFIQDAAVVGDSLVMMVSYGGGCETHDFGLCWDGAFAESNPVQAGLFVSHDGHDDPCDANPSQELTFDLTPMKDAWIAGYQQQNGTILLNLQGWMGQLSYSF